MASAIAVNESATTCKDSAPSSRKSWFRSRPSSRISRKSSNSVSRSMPRRACECAICWTRPTCAIHPPPHLPPRPRRRSRPGLAAAFARRRAVLRSRSQSPFRPKSLPPLPCRPRPSSPATLLRIPSSIASLLNLISPEPPLFSFLFFSMFNLWSRSAKKYTTPLLINDPS